MAVQGSDLLVVQSEANGANASKLYKLAVTDLDSYFRSDYEYLESIQAELPLVVDNDVKNPTISINEATTTLSGAVNRLATVDDVSAVNNDPSVTAVVTADLLQDTNTFVLQIEARLDTLVDTVSNLSSDVIDLNDKVDNLTLVVNDLSDDIDAIQEGIDGGVYAP